MFLKHGYGKNADTDIHSPKSAGFTHDGSKFYINSLEGCKTVSYRTKDLSKIKVVDHSFKSGTGRKWLAPSSYYPFTHYSGGESKSFKGKPVEMTLSKDGKYLFHKLKDNFPVFLSCLEIYMFEV